MYFSSLSPDGASISVAKLNGVYRTKILHNGDAKKNLRLENPSSIAVHPVNGFVHAVFSRKVHDVETCNTEIDFQLMKFEYVCILCLGCCIGQIWKILIRKTVPGASGAHISTEAILNGCSLRALQTTSRDLPVSSHIKINKYHKIFFTNTTRVTTEVQGDGKRSWENPWTVYTPSPRET